MTGLDGGDVARPAGRWWTDAAIDRIAGAYGALILLQFATVALYEAGVLAGPVAAVAGLATSLVGPVLSFLASTHTVLHRHLSKRRNILVVGLTYATTCLSFAVLYLLIADNDPHAFAMSAAESPFGLGKALYFSVVTISTTGYGDISPFSGLARCVACWEIITGMLFQVFIFSVLASLLLPAPGR